MSYVKGEMRKAKCKMKKSLLYGIFFVLFTFCLLHFTFPCFALDVPPLKGYVNDYADMMQPETKAKIESELMAFEKSDSTQIVVLTIPSLQGESLEGFAIRVVESWKIGQTGKDNGVLFLVAKQERKIRIEVGRGLEGKLTDLTAGRIIDLVISPKFKRGEFDVGFAAGIHSVIDATRGEFKAEPRRTPQKRGGFSPVITLLIFGGIALLFIGRASRVAGGAAGALGLPAVAWFFMGLPLFTIILMAIVGLLMGIFLPVLFSGRGSDTGGGFWFGGGGWGTGGGDGGGFGGGFSGGGGDFGGGGSSGDW